MVTMDSWQTFLAGLIAGWAVGLILDYLFWRNRRKCKDIEIKLREENENLTTQQGQLTTQLAKLGKEQQAAASLRAALEEREAAYHTATAQIEANNVVAAEMEKELSELRKLDNRTGILETRIQERDIEIARLREQASQVGELKDQVRQRDAALLKLREHVNRAQNFEDEISKRDSIIEKLQTAAAGAAVGVAATADGDDQEAHIATLEEAVNERDAQIAHLIKEQTSLEYALQDKAPMDDNAASARIAELERLVQERDDSLLAIRNRVASHVGELEAKLKKQEHELDRLRLLEMDAPQVERANMETAPLASLEFSDEGERAPDPPLVKVTPSKPDDLKKIYGIGPKISRLWHRKGVKSFADLAEATVQQVEAIQEETSRKFGVSPEEQHRLWTEQATLAAAGNWDEFQAYLDRLRRQKS